MNISDIDIPDDVVDIASLGPKFSLPGNINKNDVLNTIKNVENAFYLKAKDVFESNNTIIVDAAEKDKQVQYILHRDPTICKQRHKIINVLNRTKNNNKH